MALTVSRDLTVQVIEDVNVTKLTEKQQALRAAVQRGEPKSLGVSQVMLGLMVMSYSIPLHYAEVTEVVRLGVPWWSGLMFVAAGIAAIILDKRCSMNVLRVCLAVSAVSALLALVAIIIYSVDINKSSLGPCVEPHCDEDHYLWKLCRGLKSTLLLFTLAQTVISLVLCFLLFRQRHSFIQYSSLNQAAPVTPTSVTPPDWN